MSGRGAAPGIAESEWAERRGWNAGADGDAVFWVLPRPLWRLFSVVWLFFLVFPVASLLAERPTPVRLLFPLIGAAVFVALYIWLMCHRPFPDAALIPVPIWPRLARLAALTAVVLVLTFADRDEWYWFLFYPAVAAGVALPARVAAAAVATLMLTAAAVGPRMVGWLQTGRITLLVTVGGFGMIGLGCLVWTIGELRAARAEIERLAVASERLRFARDLHDLLGHSLSAVAVKTALARRLIPVAPERALRELDDVQAVTQGALREVREAVAGYRQPVLVTELANAREILAAAGVACRCEETAVPLPAAVESVLAWAVREGVTNAVRHSRAQCVTIRIEQDERTVSVEITDDGIEAAPAAGSPQAKGGSGLRGLAERAAAVGGRVEAAPCPDGGFRLHVALPIPLDAERRRA